MANQAPPVAGFPRCQVCPYLRTGAAAVCHACVLDNSQRIGEHHCPVCYQTLSTATEPCRNALCGDPTRSITRIHAVAVFAADLGAKIKRLKGGNYGWAPIFARLMIGWLEHNRSQGRYDIIVHNPDFVPSGQAWRGHTAAVLEAAIIEDTLGLWPIADPRQGLLTLAGRPPTSKGGNYGEKRAAAIARHRLLRLADPAAMRGKRVLVYDDICTTGSQLDAVARFLTEAGALDVEGLVLARAPWGP